MSDNKRSEWMKGLLFAEEQSQSGWRVCELDYVEQWFSWTYQDTEAKQTVFGEVEWLDGVRAYYSNKYQHKHIKRLCGKDQ